MTVTDYSAAGPLDPQPARSIPDVGVRVTYQGQQCTGFIDARRERDGLWDAWVDYSPLRGDAMSHRRRDWVRATTPSQLSCTPGPLTPSRATSSTRPNARG